MAADPVDVQSAFRYVTYDFDASLASLLCAYDTAEWSRWRNQDGESIQAVAERVGSVRCLETIEKLSVPVEGVSPTNYSNPVSPKSNIPSPSSFEREITVSHNLQTDMVVEVPERHVLTVTNRMPIFEEKIHQQDTIVPERITVERGAFDHKTTQEVVDVDVPVRTIRESAQPKFIAREDVEHFQVDVPFILPGSNTTTVMPSVNVRESRHLASSPELQVTEKTEEVPTVVTVPTVNVVKKTETVEVLSAKIVTINHIERTERIREVAQPVQVVDTVVEVPQVNKVQIIEHVLKQVEPGTPNAQYLGELVDEHESSRIDLHTNYAYVELLQQEVNQLRETLNMRRTAVEQIRNKTSAAKEDVTMLTEKLKTKRSQTQGSIRLAGASPTRVKPK